MQPREKTTTAWHVSVKPQPFVALGVARARHFGSGAWQAHGRQPRLYFKKVCLIGIQLEKPSGTYVRCDDEKAVSCWLDGS